MDNNKKIVSKYKASFFIFRYDLAVRSMTFF